MVRAHETRQTAAVKSARKNLSELRPDSSRLDEPRHELRTRRNDHSGTRASPFEWRDAAPQSFYRVKSTSKRRVATIILATQMTCQCAIVDFFG